MSASSYSGNSHPARLGATNATLRTSPPRSRLSMSFTAWPDPASPNAIASANGGRVRAPGARISVSKPRFVPPAQLTRCSAAATASTVARTNRASRLGGDFRQGMARCRSQPERLRHCHGPVDEPIVLRHEGHGDAIADESSQGEQRLQARHAAANDYDPAGDGALA